MSQLLCACAILGKITVDGLTLGDACSGADLVERIRSGDQQAEAELFNRYQRGISCILRQRGVSPDVTEDLFQETVKIVIEKIRGGFLRESNSLSAFICSVAKNLALAHFRSLSRMSPVAVEDVSVPSTDDQHEELLRKEEARIVRHVIGQLVNDRDRQVIIRYYLKNEDKAKICEDLGLSSEHFSRVLYRALQRFKEAFAQHTKSGGGTGERQR